MAPQVWCVHMNCDTFASLQVSKRSYIFNALYDRIICIIKSTNTICCGYKRNSTMWNHITTQSTEDVYVGTICVKCPHKCHSKTTPSVWNFYKIYSRCCCLLRTYYPTATKQRIFVALMIKKTSAVTYAIHTQFQSDRSGFDPI